MRKKIISRPIVGAGQHVQVDFYRRVCNNTLPPKSCNCFHFSCGIIKVVTKRPSAAEMWPCFLQVLMLSFCLVALSIGRKKGGRRGMCTGMRAWDYLVLFSHMLSDIVIKRTCIPKAFLWKKNWFSLKNPNFDWKLPSSSHHHSCLSIVFAFG